MKISVLWLAGAAALAVSFTGCPGRNTDNGAAKKAPPPAPVSVARVEQKPMPVEIRAIGNVEAFATVAVRSQVDGQLIEVRFREGQEVKKGDPLFKVDPRSYQGTLNRALADLARDMAQLENARIEERRYRELAEKDYASRQDYDKARATLAELEAAVRGDHSAISNATLRVEWTDIRSPIDGVTGNLLRHAGNVVKANDDLLVTINQIHPINVTFTVPEQHLAVIRWHQRQRPLEVEATPSGSSGPPERGTLSFINNTVDLTTGTIQLKATFANSDNALWPGQFANVVLKLTVEPQAIVVPSQAVQAGQAGPFVLVVKPDHTVEMRPVDLARSHDGVAVIARGLRAGETVVADGHLRLVPGAKVDIKPAIRASGPGSFATETR
jgi:multidrug efflux system membrane fusion protein